MPAERRAPVPRKDRQAGGDKEARIRRSEGATERREVDTARDPDEESGDDEQAQEERDGRWDGEATAGRGWGHGGAL